jgi:serine/threonine-protein kinase
MNAAESPDLDRSIASFLQDRLRQEGLAGALLSGLALGFRVVGILILGAEPLYAGSMGAHALATAQLLLLGFLMRRSVVRSLRFMRVAEPVLLSGTSIAMSAMILFIPFPARPDMIALLAMTLIAIARATLVPSSPRYTTLLTTLLGAPIVVFTWIALRREPIAPFPDATPTVAAIGAACWWTLTVMASTSTTKVIFGLRRDVHEAKRLGQYVLLEKLGEGGMGSVWRAQHALLRRPTAVKLLPADRNGADDIARFEREVRLTASLTHPNTVTVFDYGRTPDGTFYYAMELLDGRNLEELVDARGPMPPARVIHVLGQVAAALVEAHGAGLVHRDVKPANVLLCRRGGARDVAKVVDFGLVKRVDPGADPHRSRADRVTGTPLYLSPEAVARPGEVGPPSDLYSLGATAYFLLTGSPPFVAKTVVELYAAHLHKDAEPISRRLPAPLEGPAARLEALVMSMLAKAPAGRPASAAALGDALAALARELPWTEADARACALDEAVPARVAAPLARTVSVDLAGR